MPPLLWVFVGAGWLLAVAAWLLARRLSRRLAELTKMYWEVKYDLGELKARLKILAPDPGEPPPQAPGVSAPMQGFVALSDIRGKTKA
jgi:hypothetical protein